MPGDPEGVVEFKAGGKKYRLFFGMRARKAVECYYDLPFFRALQRAMPQLSAEDMKDPKKVAEASADIRLTDIGKLFEFAFLKHHPDIDEAEVDDLIDELGLARASQLLTEALTAAMVEEDGSGAAENPRPRASPKKKTGSRSLAHG